MEKVVSAGFIDNEGSNWNSSELRRGTLAGAMVGKDSRGIAVNYDDLLIFVKSKYDLNEG